MKFKLLIILFCFTITSCNTNPSSKNESSNAESYIPQHNYQARVDRYMAENSEAVARKDIDETLRLTKKSITDYLYNVGQINECSKYTFSSYNVASSVNLAKPISIYLAKEKVSNVVKQAKEYANIHTTSFDFDSDGIIQNGVDSMGRIMNEIQINAETKYYKCKGVSERIKHPFFSVKKYKYELIFNKEYYKNNIASKLLAVYMDECRAINREAGFDPFPNGYKRLAENTYGSVKKALGRYNFLENDMIMKDQGRYRIVYMNSGIGSIFRSSPCRDFAEEYYEILGKAPILIRWY